MKAAEVRKAFLDFFAAQHHEVVSSGSLVPTNDPTLLFTNAGMVPFKDLFTGAEKRSYKRATTAQKCVRAGGKHNDLDEVGKTPRHHTFFEMLGNFSFGDYFKQDAVTWAWKLLTEVYGIDKDRLCITVFGGDAALGVGPDDEARAIWKDVTGLSDDRIIGLGVKDNFWMMGDTGPMGPCTEIHYFVDGKPGDKPKSPTADPASWPGWLEIWNLVFMQFERRTPGGELFTLPAPSIDTGAGLERVTAVMNGKKSNYDTDLFVPLLQTAAALAKKTYGDNADADTSMRVIADHARCASFLIADGVFPDKTGREYVLRRIFRRAVRHGKLLGITEPFMHHVCGKVIEEMSAQYPELRERSSIIHEVALEEEKRFRATLDRGLAMLDQEFTELSKAGSKKLPGQTVFTLYDTFGFPDDLTEIVAGERGFTIDKAAFDDAMAKAKELSRFGGSDQEAVSGIYKALANDLSTTFMGYDSLAGEGKLRALVVDGEQTEHASVGASVALVFDQTSFYAESGGQTGDAGTITAVDGSCEIEITDTKKPAGSMSVLFGTVKRGTVSMRNGATPTFRFAVDGNRRDRIRANHSATHLLHLALKKYCGDHVAQKGSLVTADRLRFDFAHFSPMTLEQRRQVEDWVNAEIRSNRDSSIEVLPIEAAKQKGAVAMFGEKYGDTVRVVSIGNESLEFCGGTHVRRAGDIGLFKLVSESGVAQGVRRIEAVTGAGAVEYVRRIEDELATICDRLKSQPFDSAARVEKLLADSKTLSKDFEKLKGKMAASGGGRDILAEAVMIKGIKVLAVAVEVEDSKVLRDTGDQLRDKLGSGVLVLAGTSAAGDIKLIAMVTKDLTDRVNAGKLLAAVAEKLGGKAGGKPDMAQGGGKDIQALPAALDTARRWIETNA